MIISNLRLMSLLYRLSNIRIALRANVARHVSITRRLISHLHAVLRLRLALTACALTRNSSLIILPRLHSRQNSNAPLTLALRAYIRRRHLPLAISALPLRHRILLIVTTNMRTTSIPQRHNAGAMMPLRTHLRRVRS